MRACGALVFAFGLALLTCDAGNAEVVVEAAADGGDACSGACEAAYPQPRCVTLLRTPHAMQATVLVTPDGRVLITGMIERSPGTPHAWVGAFDSQGNSLWELDFADMHGANAIAQTKTGFAIETYSITGADSRIVSTDDAGHVSSTYTLLDADPNAGLVIAMLDTSGGLLLGGRRDDDLWLGRLGSDGQLSTLFTEDYAGLPDTITHLARSGDTIGVIAGVPVANHSNGDLIRFDVYDTLFLEFDEQGNEQRRMVFSSGSDTVSTVVNDLELGPDGTWVLAGLKQGDDFSPPGTLGWAAAIRDGEVAWTFEMPASVVPRYSLPWSWFSTVAMSTDVLLGGSTGSVEGGRRWTVRLNGKTGELLDEMIGMPSAIAPDAYGGGSALGERAIFVGETDRQDGIEQWLCDTPI